MSLAAGYFAIDRFSRFQRRPRLIDERREGRLSKTLNAGHGQNENKDERKYLEASSVYGQNDRLCMHKSMRPLRDLEKGRTDYRTTKYG